MVLPREFLLSCVSFFFFSLPSSQPVPSFYNGVFLDVPGSPVLFFCKQSMFCPRRLGKSLYRFFSFFPSLGSDSFESLWLAILFGTCWGMPFSASPFLAYSSFPFLSYLGGILFCHFWKSFVAILLPCPGSPRPFFCLCHERSLAFLVFFFSCLLFIDLSQSSFLFVLEGICAYWGSLLLYALPWSFFWMLLSFLGFRILWAFLLFPHGSSVSIALGLAWIFFLLGLTCSSVFGLILLWPFLDLNRLQACLLRDVGVIRCTSKVIVPIKQLWLCVS